MSRDPGLQPERTTLSRQRTVLSVGLGSLVLALGQLRYGQPVLAIPAALLAIIAVLPGILRPARKASLESSRGNSSWAQLVRTSAVGVLLSLLGATAALWHLLL